MEVVRDMMTNGVQDNSGSSNETFHWSEHCLIFCDLYSESEQRQTMAQNVACLLEAIYVILRLSVYRNMQREAPNS